jgi:hypothetical protein
VLIDRVIVTNDEVEMRYVLPISPDGEQLLFYQLRIDYYRALVSLVEGGVCLATPVRELCRSERSYQCLDSVEPTRSAHIRH